MHLRTEAGLKPSFVKGEPPSDANTASVTQRIACGERTSIDTMLAG